MALKDRQEGVVNITGLVVNIAGINTKVIIRQGHSSFDFSLVEKSARRAAYD